MSRYELGSLGALGLIRQRGPNIGSLFESLRLWRLAMLLGSLYEVLSIILEFPYHLPRTMGRGRDDDTL